MIQAEAITLIGRLRIKKARTSPLYSPQSDKGDNDGDKDKDSDSTLVAGI